MYIGETGRCIKFRMAEHRNVVRNAEATRRGVTEHPPLTTSPYFHEANNYKRQIRQTVEMISSVGAVRLVPGSRK